MPADSLVSIQRQFLAILYEDAPDRGAQDEVGTGIVRSDALRASERLAIYRNNLRANFRSVLALEFPVIEQLCGADYFRQLATEFQRAHPSRSGNLHHIGAAFPAWLTTRLADSDYPWFGDVAALEWAWQECYVAADVESRADFSRLTNLTAAQQESLRLLFIPACRLVRSRWPVLAIWQAHQQLDVQANALDQIDLKIPQNVLVLRGSNAVSLHGLTAAEAVLVQSLMDQQALGDAIAHAAGEATGADGDGEFDVAAALQRLGALEVFAGFQHG